MSFIIVFWGLIMDSHEIFSEILQGIDKALDLGDAAGKYALAQNMIRYGVIVVAFGALCVMDFGNPIAAFAGIMGLKAGAYLQPFTHKIIIKFQRR